MQNYWALVAGETMAEEAAIRYYGQHDACSDASLRPSLEGDLGCEHHCPWPPDFSVGNLGAMVDYFMLGHRKFDRLKMPPSSDTMRRTPNQAGKVNALFHGFCTEEDCLECLMWMNHYNQIEVAQTVSGPVKLLEIFDKYTICSFPYARDNHNIFAVDPHCDADANVRFKSCRMPGSFG